MNPSSSNRRTLLCATIALIAAPVAIFLSGCSETEESEGESNSSPISAMAAMKIHYLEIVTPDVEAAVALYSQIHGVSFDAPNPNFGGARTAELNSGGLLGIRVPLRDTEQPVVRPYYLVNDIEEAVALASRAGVQIAMGPTEIPGDGRFAIFIQGGIETGLWELSP